MAAAALDALGQAVARCGAALEPFLDRVLPRAAWRLTDAKGGIREAAAAVMTCAP